MVPMGRQGHQSIHSLTHSVRMYCAPMLRTQELGGLGVQLAAGGCLADKDLDQVMRSLSPTLATLWPEVALGPPWPNISQCFTAADIPESYCPLSPQEGNTALVGKSLENDLPLASAR